MSQTPQTARSSTTTIVDPSVAGSSRPGPAVVKPDRESLDQEISRDEQRIEKYGADDIRAPSERRPDGTAEPEPEETTDARQVSWDGADDPQNPQNWSTRYKWFITILCSVMTVNVTFASSAPTSATMMVAKQFHVQAEVTYLLTTVFLLGYVFGPLFWGPGSELVGRRPIFILAMSCYTIFHLGQALAQNIETLLVTRFLSGFFAAAPVTNCGGVIADIWSAAGRGPATSLFTASVFLGPVLGPIISGYIVESHLSWRWVFWVMMIFAGSCTAFVILAIPETYAPVILSRKAKKLRKADPVANKDVYAEHEKQDWSIRGVVHRTLYRPFHMLFMEPVLVLITVYLSLVYGVLYALFQAFPIVFIERRGFTIAQDGLIFIGIGIGTTLGSLLNYRLSTHYPELILKWRGFPPPEQRLFGAMIGGPGLVIGAFWLGWTGEYSAVPWYVPGLSTIMIGFSISMIFMSFLSYLVDTYLMYSASAFAANTMIRSAVAAAFPLFTVQMFDNLGVNWASTLLGLVLLLLAPSPYLFYIYGPRIRARSKFAPCIDLKIAKELEAEEQHEKGPKV
ncbi:putative MFS general substrate transporter [Lyophyllum shimeji]|uniref:MFS general substrate transporter n=1 Tax=Lyophyllum shimeji TaxID=47721 RepID=A0A9P3PSR8_LYOSH|nr:putative MFS general substrate transporter [Lyophyllum shimeji]